jgi:hypothetical protein
MRSLQRFARVSVGSTRFVEQILSAGGPATVREILRAYEDKKAMLGEKVITVGYCAAREHVRSSCAKVAYNIVVLALEHDRDAIKFLRDPKQLSTLRSFRRECGFVRSRLWFRIILASLGDSWSINALSDDIDVSDWFQQQAILVRLSELQRRRANRTLSRISKNAKNRSVRAAAGLLLVLKKCKAGLEVLRAEAALGSAVGTSQIDANFGLAWAGERSGIEWIQHRMASQPSEGALVQLWRKCDAYGCSSNANRTFFRTLQLTLEELVDRAKLGKSSVDHR